MMKRNAKIGIGIVIVVAIVVFFGAPIMPVQWNSTSLQSIGLSGNNVVSCLYPCTRVTADASPSFVFLNCGMLGDQTAHFADGTTTQPSGARWRC